MRRLIQALAALMCAVGFVVVLDGLVSFGLESILYGVFAIAIGGWVLLRTA